MDIVTHKVEEDPCRPVVSLHPCMSKIQGRRGEVDVGLGRCGDMVNDCRHGALPGSL